MIKYLSMAALMVVGAIMTGCSSDDNIDNPQQPANKDNGTVRGQAQGP